MFPTARGCSALCTAGKKIFIASSGSIDPETLSGEEHDTPCNSMYYVLKISITTARGSSKPSQLQKRYTSPLHGFDCGSRALQFSVWIFCTTPVILKRTTWTVLKQVAEGKFLPLSRHWLKWHVVTWSGIPSPFPTCLNSQLGDLGDSFPYFVLHM